MTHRELLRLIRDEFARYDHVYTDKDFFHTLLPEEDFEPFRSSWSNWCNGTSGKMKPEIRSKINKVLNFESNTWDADHRTQVEVIREAVKNFLYPTPKVDLSALLPQNTPLSNTQTQLLNQVNNTSKQATLALLETHAHYLEPVPENQNFLLKLLTLLYDKGMYDTLDEKVFPVLLPHNAQSIQVKLFKAHTFGSLSKPDYLRAAILLNSISSDSQEQVLELKTGVISNVRRYHLEKEELTREELGKTLSVLIGHYTDVFENVQKHHYYPAVNLMYMLRLSMFTSPNQPQIEENDLVQIHKDAKLSISRGKTSTSKETRYYASISEVEFALLLGQKHVDTLLTNLLELEEPSVTYVQRTVRLIVFFVRILEKFSVVDGSDILARFREVIGVLEGYVEVSV